MTPHRYRYTLHSSTVSLQYVAWLHTTHTHAVYPHHTTHRLPLPHATPRTRLHTHATGTTHYTRLHTRAPISHPHTDFGCGFGPFTHTLDSYIYSTVSAHAFTTRTPLRTLPATPHTRVHATRLRFIYTHAHTHTCRHVTARLLHTVGLHTTVVVTHARGLPLHHTTLPRLRTYLSPPHTGYGYTVDGWLDLCGSRYTLHTVYAVHTTPHLWFMRSGLVCWLHASYGVTGFHFTYIVGGSPDSRFVRYYGCVAVPARSRCPGRCLIPRLPGYILTLVSAPVAVVVTTVTLPGFRRLDSRCGVDGWWLITNVVRLPVTLDSVDIHSACHVDPVLR